MFVVTELRHHLGCRYQLVQNNLSTSAGYRLIGSLNNIPGISHSFLVPFPRYPVLSLPTKNSHSDDMGSPFPSQRIILEELRARPFDRIIFQFPQHKERNKARRGKVASLFGSLKDDGWGALFFDGCLACHLSQGISSACWGDVVLRDLGVSCNHLDS